MIVAALAAIGAAMLLIRLGWAGRRGIAVGGWAISAGALLLLAWRDGAWGLAIGTVAGIAVALLAVLWAAATAEARPYRVPREAPAAVRRAWSRGLARRLTVFVLVVPIGFAAAQGLAFGVQALMRERGAAPADATVAALFLQPLVWAGLMAWQMTRDGPARMAVAPAVVACAGALAWGVR